jgi:hypothetical protein
MPSDDALIGYSTVELRGRQLVFTFPNYYRSENAENALWFLSGVTSVTGWRGSGREYIIHADLTPGADASRIVDEFDALIERRFDPMYTGAYGDMRRINIPGGRTNVSGATRLLDHVVKKINNAQDIETMRSVWTPTIDFSPIREDVLRTSPRRHGVWWWWNNWRVLYAYDANDGSSDRVFLDADSRIGGWALKLSESALRSRYGSQLF